MNTNDKNDEVVEFEINLNHWDILIIFVMLAGCVVFFTIT